MHLFPRAEDGVPDAGEVGLPSPFEEIDGEHHTADDRDHRKEICGERASHTGDCRAHGGKPRLDGGEHQADGPGRGDHSPDDDQHGTQGHGQGQEDPGQPRQGTCELLEKQDGLRYPLDDRRDHRQECAAEDFSEVSDLLAHKLELTPDIHIHGPRHSFSDGGARLHRVFDGADVALQGLHPLGHLEQELHRFVGAERFLDLHLRGGLGQVRKARLDLLENGDDPLESPRGIHEGQPQLLTGFRRLHDESLVKRSGFRTGHGGLQLSENGELFLQRNVGGGGHRTDVFDGFRHLRPCGLERRHGLGHGSGEGLGPLHVGHIRHDRFEDAVPTGEGADHLLDAGFRGFRGQGCHGGECAHGFVAQGG